MFVNLVSRMYLPHVSATAAFFGVVKIDFRGARLNHWDGLDLRRFAAVVELSLGRGSNNRRPVDPDVLVLRLGKIIGMPNHQEKVAHLNLMSTLAAFSTFRIMLQLTVG